MDLKTCKNLFLKTYYIPIITYLYRPVSFIGIFLICFGTGKILSILCKSVFRWKILFIGGIKPCVVSLGADQFKVKHGNNNGNNYINNFSGSRTSKADGFILCHVLRIHKLRLHDLNYRHTTNKVNKMRNYSHSFIPIYFIDALNAWAKNPVIHWLLEFQLF